MEGVVHTVCCVQRAHCAVYIVAAHRVHSCCTQGAHCAVHTVILCNGCTVLTQCTLRAAYSDTVHCTLHSVVCNVHCVQQTVHPEQWMGGVLTVYSSQSRLPSLRMICTDKAELWDVTQICNKVTSICFLPNISISIQLVTLATFDLDRFPAWLLVEVGRRTWLVITLITCLTKGQKFPGLCVYRAV